MLARCLGRVDTARRLTESTRTTDSEFVHRRVIVSQRVSFLHCTARRLTRSSVRLCLIPIICIWSPGLYYYLPLGRFVQVYAHLDRTYLPTYLLILSVLTHLLINSTHFEPDLLCVNYLEH